MACGCARPPLPLAPCARSDAQAKVLFQQNFEHSLDQLIGAIRAQFKVSEKAMDSSFKIHQVWRESQSVRPLYCAREFHTFSSHFHLPHTAT